MYNHRICGKQRISLLVSDIDGTLVTPQKSLTERSCRAVERLREAGIAFAVTSGRPPRGMSMFVEPLRISAPLAAYNGGVYVNPDLSVISQENLDPRIVRSLVHLMQSSGLSVWLFRDSDWLVRDKHNPHVDREELTVQYSAMVVDDFDDLTEGVAKVVGVSDDYDLVARCEDRVRRELGDRVSASRSQPYYLDVTHPKANKGQVIRWFSRFFNISREEIAAIGDGPNDVQMFALSGLSIAMGNASAEVRRMAQYVTAPHDQEGFAEAIERYLMCETASAIT
jgi:Cof subfamily protein (haloacid dehalogenase superfamily)